VTSSKKFSGRFWILMRKMEEAPKMIMMIIRIKLMDLPATGKILYNQSIY
jgi:hypothetical protein